MSYLQVFPRVFFLIFLGFLLFDCSTLEKQRQQEQVLLRGKTFTVENRSEDEIYLSLLGWSGKTSTYERVGDLSIGNGKMVIVDSYFLTERGSINLSDVRSSVTRGRTISIITYQVMITVSGNQVIAEPRLISYCRPRNKGSDIKGNLSDFRCQEIDNSFNGFTFRILNFFNNFYNRVERVINEKRGN